MKRSLRIRSCCSGRSSFTTTRRSSGGRRNRYVRCSIKFDCVYFSYWMMSGTSSTMPCIMESPSPKRVTRPLPRHSRLDRQRSVPPRAAVRSACGIAGNRCTSADARAPACVRESSMDGRAHPTASASPLYMSQVASSAVSPLSVRHVRKRVRARYSSTLQ